MIRSSLVRCVLLVGLLLAAGCAAFHTSGAVQSGRNALIRGEPKAAIAHFRGAAEANPQYRYPNELQTGVWTYLGRAYYEAGNYPEALRSLDRALSIHKEDHIARLYHGLALLQSADQKTGRAEAESGLRGLRILLERLTANMFEGAYWDPAGRLRSDLRQALTGNGALPTAEFISVAQRIGSSFDIEPDRKTRDEAADKFRTDP